MSRINRETDVFTVLSKDFHNAFQIQLEQRVDFLLPYNLISECIQTDRNLVIFFIAEEWHDELRETLLKCL